jgi:serine/threonine-protein kinase
MIGQTISHYKILAKLGEGGMGVVYKAEDTKLKRIVALKFLSALALSGEDKSRFLREAQAAAALNHPNICTIHAIDEVDGQMFIAMEFIEGQSLREKINAGPLKIDEAIKFAMQIADGLQAAHEKGITHRDIKSANIMITEKSQVKIMDFGLAKLARGGTMLTKEGMTLGTAAYMSPEQAQGEVVDHRTDIWSLGVVLYEMISGRLPFRGEYEAAMMYSIVNENPEPLTSLRSNVPMDLERVVAKMLAKNPAERYQHVDELPVDLKAMHTPILSKARILTKAADLAIPKNMRPKLAVSLGIVGFIVGAVLAGLAVWLGSRPSPLPVNRWQISLPESAPLAPIGSAPLSIGQPALALSPDGSNLVYVADIGGNTQLYLRPLDQFDALPISGTEGAFCPFFSPDGKWIGFFAGNELKKISISGGAVVSLCEVANPTGATWGIHNKIIFSAHEGKKLFSVSSSGGIPNLIVEVATWYFWPQILPGGETVLTSQAEGEATLVSLESGKETYLGINGSNVRYVRSGHLVYGKDNRLEAVAFDLAALKINGSPVPVIDNVRMEPPRGATQWAVSDNGTVVYLSGTDQRTSELVWIDRSGKAELAGFPPETYHYSFRISPDGKRLAIPIKRNRETIWIYDFEKKSRTKLNLEGSSRSPVWSFDSKSVMFTWWQSGEPIRILMKSTDGREDIKMLMEDKEHFIDCSSISPDGNLLTCARKYDLWLLHTDGKTPLQPFANSSFNEWGAAFSPDGQWIAYVSDEQGQYNIYVQPYPQTGQKWQISTEGGEEPAWSPVSNELFYRNDRKWMVVSYSTNPKFSAELPRVLFEGDYINVPGRSYDVSPDGRRFLLLKSSEEPLRQTRLNVVTNWFEEVKRKAPRGK